uniref:Tata box-binding protein 1 n=1 Tax=Triatoma infestans TaxID=30076 RepID=A0A170UVJ3_TRIIF
MVYEFRKERTKEDVIDAMSRKRKHP